MAGCAMRGAVDLEAARMEAAAPTQPEPSLELPRERVLGLPALLSVVFAALPPDARLLCREVCTAWRRLLDDAAFWTELDFSDATHKVDEALLTAAAARSAGGLRSLILPPALGQLALWGDACFPESVVRPALLQVLCDNAASLRHLNALGFTGTNAISFEPLLCSQLAAILAAAPALETLKAHVHSFDAVSLLPVLQREHVQLTSLHLQHEASDLDVPRMRELAAAIACQRSTLQRVELLYVPLDVAPEALFDAFLACPRLAHLELRFPTVSQDVLAGLARLLRADMLVSFTLSEVAPSAELWESRAAAMAFAAALRACKRLTHLSLTDIGLLAARGSVGAEAALMASLVGHPSLEDLSVGEFPGNTGEFAAPALLGAWLGAVVAANTPALKCFCFSCASLSDADALPFFASLAFNTHLRWIVIYHHSLSIDFMRDVALPAIRANTSLRRASVPLYYAKDFEANDARTMALKDIDAQIKAALHGRGEADDL
jgi:hypothetical protein